MKLVVAVIAAALLLAGCSGSASDEVAPKPSATAGGDTKELARAELEKQVKEQAEQADRALGTVVEMTISEGKATPQGKRVNVKVGDKVTLQMTSDATEEIHVHSDPEHSYELTPGKTVTESFTIERPGQVAVEAHHLGITVVQLVVRP